MLRFFVSVLVSAACLPAADDPAVFKTDVALTRVDAQVLDRDGRAVTHLQADDFVLRMNGQVLPIRNFASENMPVDILLLLDVSGSMQPHVQRIAMAAQDALNVLAEKDRVAITVFDTRTRVRLPFTGSHSQVTGELNRLLRSEGFNGGTRITDALISAANYVGREARPNARRAIVILTDDQTQDSEDEPRVEAALTRANAVLSFLQAPYEPPQPGPYGGPGHRRGGGTWGGGGGGWPGSGRGPWPGGGGPIGFPGGGPVILGRGGVDPSHSAGTATIAADSGGDTMPVSSASALEDTLARLRRRYALYFYLPEGARSSGSSVQVDLSQEAKFRYDGAEVRSRRVYLAGNGRPGETAEPTVVTHVQRPTETSVNPTLPDETTPKGRRKAVNESSGPAVNTVGDDASASEQKTPSTQAPQKSGWPRASQQ
ncbi:MAG: VWA domain-containing protein [Acidobacteriaceae bacterium]|nr:VWA domain-containing protein [Acidobacteriaceae bacterium]